MSCALSKTKTRIGCAKQIAQNLETGFRRQKCSGIPLVFVYFFWSLLARPSASLVSVFQASSVLDLDHLLLMSALTLLGLNRFR
uniref:Uncharacterized protein n=1 Tax=Globodera rostochiensis TaxID=31243 RepID=A0A914HP60_GLORO